MLSSIFYHKNKIIFFSGLTLFVTALLAGCSSHSPADSEMDNGSEYIEYNGVKRNKKDLSDDTIQWLEWYQSLPEAEQEALAIVPSEFMSDNTSAAAESESSRSSGEHTYHYSEALTDSELFETEELVRVNYEEANDAEVFEVVPDDFPWYANKGIEDEYTPGNIIIYRILTEENRLNGNGYLIVSIGRHSKSDPWKVINSGF